jgi:hypothetical protein
MQIEDFFCLIVSLIFKDNHNTGIRKYFCDSFNPNNSKNLIDHGFTRIMRIYADLYFLNIFLKCELSKIDNNIINNMLQLFQTLPDSLRCSATRLYLHVFRVKAHTPRHPVKPGDNRGALYIIVIREYPPHPRISVFHFMFLYVYE